MLGALPKKYAAFDSMDNGVGRIVLLGGSGTYEGFDSRYLSAELKRPVYNLGCHAGLGLVYQLRSAKGHLRKSDLVLVAPEYANFTGQVCYGNTELVSMVADILPGERSLISWRQWLILSPYVLEYGGTKIRNLFCRYARDKSGDFDAFGDNLWDERFPQDAVGHFGAAGALGRTAFASDAVDHLIEFHRYAESLGARVVLMPAAYSRDWYERQCDFIAIVAERLRQAGLPYLCDPERLALERKYFFDTAYHLNPVGRRRRSELVAEVLKASGVCR